MSMVVSMQEGVITIDGSELMKLSEMDSFLIETIEGYRSNYVRCVSELSMSEIIISLVNLPSQSEDISIRPIDFNDVIDKDDELIQLIVRHFRDELPLPTSEQVDKVSREQFPRLSPLEIREIKKTIVAITGNKFTSELEVYEELLSLASKLKSI